MPIPSIGIDTRDIVDPGMINIEEQAYPRAVNDVLSETFRTPVEVDVADLGLPQLPVLGASSGSVATPAEVEVDVAAQNVIRQPVADYIVTPVGNFQTNPSVPTSVRRSITAVSTFLSAEGITFYVITFGPTVNLMIFGVDLVGTEAAFPNSAPALAPEDVPTGFVTKFTNRQIVVDGTDLTADAPQVGDSVDLDVSRHGAEVNFDFETVIDVNIEASTRPITPDPVDFELLGRVVTVLAGTVGTPPIVPGGLQALPRVLDTTFVERVGVPVGENAPSAPPVIDVFK